MTSQTGHELEVALTMALVAEAPLAILCVWVARNSERVSAGRKSLRGQPIRVMPPPPTG